MDKNSNREVQFVVGGERYTFLPITREKCSLISKVYGRLEIDAEHLKVCYPLEFLRVVKKHRFESCMFVALCVSEDEEQADVNAVRFHKEMADDDIAAMIAILLVYYSDIIQKYGKEASL